MNRVLHDLFAYKSERNNSAEIDREENFNSRGERKRVMAGEKAKKLFWN